MQSDFINRIAIGTTKFGMPYGAVESLQVDEVQVERIFSKAYELDFDCFDTAPSYGNAEQLMGKYLAPELKSSCITKVAKISDPEINSDALLAIEDYFQASLQNMQTHTCYGLLVHDVRDLYKPGAEQLVEWMQSLQEKGRVNKIGVSVYTPEEAQDLYDRFDFDLIQLPCNIFDQRFLKSGVLAMLANQDVEIHARSLFLKGLMLKPSTSANLPHALLAHNAKFHTQMKQQNIQAYDACISFAKSLSLVNRWVIGVSSEQQLEQLINSNHSININFDEWAFNDAALLDPRSW